MREKGISQESETQNSDAHDLVDMQRLKAGHDAALNDLMERHSGKLFGFLMRSLQNEDDAADTAQECFVRVYQNKSRFDEKQRFSSWLYAIAVNLIKDSFRWRTRHPLVSMDAEPAEGEGSLGSHLKDERPNPSDNAETKDRVDSVRKAVVGLPDELRTPLILAEYEEKSQAEIAEILGCSIKAVETRIYRARQRLRNDLSSLLNGN